MSPLAYVSLVMMAMLYLFAGVMHFAVTRFYLQIMPDYLPWHLTLVYLSGLCEIGLGALLLVPRWRRWAAWGVILLLVAVFPANVYMATHHIRPGGIPDWVADSVLALGPRLLIQLLLIAWAFRYTRPPRAH